MPPIALAVANTAALQYTYDKGNLSAVQRSNKSKHALRMNVQSMGYDGLRRLTSVTGGPVSRQYTYRDIGSTKTTLQVASVTSGGQQYGYTYDSMGNIATYSAPGKATVTYTYDNQGQLLSAAGDTTCTYGDAAVQSKCSLKTTVRILTVLICMGGGFFRRKKADAKA